MQIGISGRADMPLAVFGTSGGPSFSEYRRSHEARDAPGLESVFAAREIPVDEIVAIRMIIDPKAAALDDVLRFVR